MGVEFGLVTDDFDSAFVRAHCAVRAKTPEFAGFRARWSCINVLTARQGRMIYIVDNADSEVILRLVCFQIGKNAFDVTGNDVFTAKTAAAAYNDRLPFFAIKGRLNVKVQRLS